MDPRGSSYTFLHLYKLQRCCRAFSSVILQFGENRWILMDPGSAFPPLIHSLLAAHTIIKATIGIMLTEKLLSVNYTYAQ